MDVRFGGGSNGGPKTGLPYVRRGPPDVRALAVLLLAFAAMCFRTAPPAPRAVDAPPSEFSAARALEVLGTLAGDGVPHPLGSEANARVRARIVERLQGLGYSPAVQTTFACHEPAQTCGTVHNVVAVRPGRLTQRPVVLAAHYDSVAAGPGASDDAVGVAAVLEAARALTTGPAHRHSIVFLLTDGEEAGLLGASGFVRDHPLGRDVGAVVNLEARGTSGPSVMFETSRDNAWLVRLLARSLSRPIASSLFYPVYERLPNDTDLTVFKQAGLPGVNFAFIGTLPHYHTPLDSVANASLSSVQHHGDNALAIVRALADADLERRPPGNAVFFDVLGFGIVRWPVAWTMPIAAIAFVLVLVAAIALHRRQRVSIWRAVLGLVAWALMIAAAGGGTWGLLRWLTSLGLWPGGATTAPRASTLAFWLVAVALVTVLAAIAGRWTRPTGAWAGCWIAWSIAGIAAAATFPEASYLLIVPALVAGIAGTASLVRRETATSGVGAIAAIPPMATAAVIVMPSAWMLFDALGPPALPVAGTAIGLVATGLAPVLTGPGARRWLMPLGALACGGALAAYAAAALAFSVDRPERMSVTFLQETGPEARARWVVSPQSGVLPEGLRRAAPFGATRESPFAWSTATGYVAGAEPVDAPPPALDLLTQERRDGRRYVRARARSARGAPVLLLRLPSDRVVSLRLGGRELSRPARDRMPPRRAYAVHAVPPEGIEIELVIDGEPPIEGYLIDRSYGLPGAGQPLLQARPAAAAPFATGDTTSIAIRVTI